MPAKSFVPVFGGHHIGCRAATRSTLDAAPKRSLARSAR
jgi:hypothetical protein